jgi:predicted dehydrogenase
MVSLGAVGSAGLPSNRVRLGVIGLRNQGKALIETLTDFTDVDVAAICDLDARQFAPVLRTLSEASRPAPNCESDFRRLLDDHTLDAVVIAAPDHWHAPLTVLACQAGKDVYLESPATHSLGEGAAMLAAARSSRRIVQVGLQERSGVHVQLAVDAVKSGAIGPVRLARAWVVHRRKSIGVRRESAAPEGVDYRQWLGPAPERPFHPNRFHFNWRWFWDYGGGELAHWGVHWLDVARWGLDVETPRRVAAIGSRSQIEGDQETPDTMSVQYEFNGPGIVWEHRLWSGHGLENRSSGVAFYGEAGTLILDRGGWKIYDAATPRTADGGDLLRPHLENFLNSIRTREAPAADLPIGIASSTLCHFGNAAYRLGREIRPSEIATDAAAHAMLNPPPRPGWKLAELLSDVPRV